MKRTGNMSRILVVCLSLFLILLVICDSVNSEESDHKCTRTRKRHNLKVILKPCTEKYKARCGWFSLTYCTFYHKVYCRQILNTTEVSYYKSVECCDGYLMTPNNTCLDLSTADPDLVARIKNETDQIQQRQREIVVYPEEPPSKVDPIAGNQQGYKGDVYRDEYYGGTPIVKMQLSHGAYAGIACAILFLLIVLAFTVVAIRKKQNRRRSLKKTRDMEDSIQKVIYQRSPKVNHAKVKLSTDNSKENVQIENKSDISHEPEKYQDDLQKALLSDQDRTLSSTEENKSWTMTDIKKDTPEVRRKRSNELDDSIKVKLLDGTSPNDEEVSTLTSDMEQRLEDSTETQL